MTSAVVAKLREPPVDVEITRLQAKLDKLEHEFEDINRELDQTILDLTTSRIEADRWRALAERREEQQRPAGPDFGVHQITEEMRLRLQAQFQAQQLMAMAQSQQASMNAQQAQHHQGLAQQNFYGEGLPQMLGQQAQALEWCNCVPARHDMFRLG
jgi:septal ring factor EnvC (AmiA/AmiB activator)